MGRGLYNASNAFRQYSQLYVPQPCLQYVLTKRVHGRWATSDLHQSTTANENRNGKICRWKGELETSEDQPRISNVVAEHICWFTKGPA